MVLSRKEVFQPHLPVRLPCYDLAPVTSFTLGRSLRLRTSGTPGSHGLTGGVYKARERIYRAVADARFFFFKQKTAYEMESRDWSSDVCSSDLGSRPDRPVREPGGP